MAERFVRVFELPENLYLTGAPLLISKGVLLKDTVTQKIIAQLKFTNLSEATISGVTIQLKAKDAYGQPISESVTNTYLDFNAKYGKSFGEKIPVFLPDDSARSYTVCVTKVLFADGTIWESEPKEWTCLPRPQLLSDYLQNTDLVEIYKEQIHKPLPGVLVEYVPTNDRDLWLCSCGHWNKADNKHCGYCHKELNDQLEKLDKDTLTNCLTDKENQQRYSAAKTTAENALSCRNCEELRSAITLFEKLQGYGDSQKCVDKYTTQLNKLEKSKKRRRFVWIAFGIGICLCMVAYYLIANVLIPQSRYKRAEKLFKSQQYTEAAEIFSELGDFKDSSEKLTDARIALLQNTPIGGEIVFGKYEQDAIDGNGKEDIEWIVLAKEDNRALVISKYCLYAEMYDDGIPPLAAATQDDSSHTLTAYWADCSLRKWLNYFFTKKPFLLMNVPE